MPWTRRERRWRDHLLAAVLPPGQRHSGVQGLDLLDFWQTFARTAPSDLRLAWRASVWLLTWLPVLSTGRPLHTLPAPRCDDLLQDWAASPNYLLRQMVTLAKMLATWALLADKSTRTTMSIR